MKFILTSQFNRRRNGVDFVEANDHITPFMLIEHDF